MLNVLPESRRVRRRGTTSGVISAAVHVGIIAAVAYASGAEPPRPPADPGREREVVYRNEPKPAEPRRTEPRPSAPTAPASPTVPQPAGPVAVPPIEVPPSLPPIGDPLGELVTRDSARVSVNGGGPGDDSRGAGADSPLPNEYADKPALGVEGNPTPRYPDLLRAAGVRGSVVMRFVIDTTGRVAARTVEARHSDDELFTAAVRAVLPRMRFLPAEANGRKVPVLVEQRFEFRLER